MAEGLTRRRMLLYVAIALAVLTKGPIGLILPGLVALIWIALEKRWRLLLQMNLRARRARGAGARRRMVRRGADRRRLGFFPQADSRRKRAPLRRRRRFPRGPHPPLLLHGTRALRRLPAVDLPAADRRRPGRARAAHGRSAPQILLRLVRRCADLLQPSAEQARRVPALHVSSVRDPVRDLSQTGDRSACDRARRSPLDRAIVRLRDADARQRHPGCARDAGRLATRVRRSSASRKHSRPSLCASLGRHRRRPLDTLARDAAGGRHPRRAADRSPAAARANDLRNCSRDGLRHGRGQRRRRAELSPTPSR